MPAQIQSPFHPPLRSDFRSFSTQLNRFLRTVAFPRMVFRAVFAFFYSDIFLALLAGAMRAYIVNARAYSVFHIFIPPFCVDFLLRI